MVTFFLTKKSSFCVLGFSSQAPQSTCFGELKNLAGGVDGKIRVGRQIGFVESSLSSDEEEEVAQGSEERNGQGDEDNEGDEAQKLPRQGLVHLQPAVADLLVRFLHCTSGKEKLLGSAKNSFSWTVKETLPKVQWP